MLIVLRKLLELILVVRKARVHAEVPVRAFGQVALLLLRGDWLWDVEGRGVFIARTQSVGVHGDALLCSSGMGEEPAVLRLQQLLLDEVLLV